MRHLFAVLYAPKYFFLFSSGYKSNGCQTEWRKKWGKGLVHSEKRRIFAAIRVHFCANITF